MDMTAIYSRIDTLRSDMITALAAAVRIPSVLGPAAPRMPYGEGPYQMLTHFLDVASAMGFSARSAGNHMGVIDYNGKASKLGILCHLDVVPEGEGWSYPPYGAVIDGTRMYGRGTIDNKAPAICVLYAMKALADCGVELSGGVRLLVGCNEESGSHDLAWYKNQETLPPMLFTPDGFYPCINTEKGRYVPVFGRVQPIVEGHILSISGSNAVNAVPAVAKAVLQGLSESVLADAVADLPRGIQIQIEKKHETFTLTVSGQAAHASRPELGANGLTALLLILSRLPLEKEEAGIVKNLCALFPYGDDHGSALGIRCEDAVSGELTCALTVMDYRSGVFSAKCDVRFPVSRRLDEISGAFARCFSACGLSLFSESAGQEGHHTDPDTPMVRTLLRVFADHTGLDPTPLSMGGGTYVHGINNAVAFGVCYMGKDCNAHRADEYVELDSLTQNAKIFADAIIRLCQ